jgi:predicted acetyltransferase
MFDDMKPSSDFVTLIDPSLENLSGYEAALVAGWSPDPRQAGNTAYITSVLQDLGKDRQAHLASLTQRDRMLTSEDAAEILLTFRLFWIWDGEFCGTASLRFQPGSEELPSQVSGHIGYSVVAWKQGRGYASSALALLLALARDEGLERIEILCNTDNHASRRVIERNGGQLFKVAPHPSDSPDRLKWYFSFDLYARDEL